MITSRLRKLAMSMRGVRFGLGQHALRYAGGDRLLFQIGQKAIDKGNADFTSCACHQNSFRLAHFSPQIRFLADESQF